MKSSKRLKKEFKMQRLETINKCNEIAGIIFNKNKEVLFNNIEKQIKDSMEKNFDYASFDILPYITPYYSEFNITSWREQSLISNKIDRYIRLVLKSNGYFVCTNCSLNCKKIDIYWSRFEYSMRCIGPYINL